MQVPQRSWAGSQQQDISATMWWKTNQRWQKNRGCLSKKSRGCLSKKSRGCLSTNCNNMFVVLCFHSGHKRQQNDFWAKKQGWPKRQNTGQGFLSGGYPKKHELIDLLFISHVFSTSKEMFGNLLFKHNPSSQERTPVPWACRRATLDKMALVHQHHPHHHQQMVVVHHHHQHQQHHQQMEVVHHHHQMEVVPQHQQHQ